MKMEKDEDPALTENGYTCLSMDDLCHEGGSFYSWKEIKDIVNASYRLVQYNT